MLGLAIGPNALGFCVRIHFIWLLSKTQVSWVLGLEPIILGFARPILFGSCIKTQFSLVLCQNLRVLGCEFLNIIIYVIHLFYNSKYSYKKYYYFIIILSINIKNIIICVIHGFWVSKYNYLCYKSKY